MLKTYSIKGNTCIVNFTIKSDRTNFAFVAEFTGGDTFGLNGKSKRAAYKTSKPLEQFAIEESEMFKRGIVTLDSCVETRKEAEAKARLAAQMAKEEEEAEADAEETPKKVAPKKK